VLDYKSNQLPGYGADELARSVREHEYDLQYLLYTLALHRWLRFRLGAAYDIGRHLGGVRYLFCRGVGQGEGVGVHALRLPDALVLALDALFARPRDREAAA
jgi:exodeoxyribonuclease V beta subunit